MKEVNGKQFEIAIDAKTIDKIVSTMAVSISNDLKGTKPIFIIVLNGSFIFASDLIKQISIDCEVAFLKVTSYRGTQSIGEVTKVMELTEKIEGRTIVIIEDIVDGGNTIEYLYNTLKSHNPKDIKIATLFFKPQTYKKNIPIDYAGHNPGNDFIVGYGLDYDGLGRNSMEVYKLKQ